MTYRKIIGFGDSSFVISLPKAWIEKNGLKKGELLDVEEKGHALNVVPHTLKPTKEVSEISIDFTGNLKDLKTRLLHAYVNNYHLINIKRTKIEEYAPAIRNVVDNFVGLDVVEQRDDKLIVSDVLNISGVSVFNHLRRIDRLVLSMSEDVKQIFLNKEDRTQALDQKDEDVNKISNLLFKVIRRAQNSNDMIILNLKINELFYYWDLIINLEEIGDHLKRIGREAKNGVSSELFDLFIKCMSAYENSMKAIYTKNRDMAVDIMVIRKIFYNSCEDLA